MMSSVFAFLMLAVTLAASVPTPKPLPTVVLPGNFQFQPQTFGSTHPAFVTIIAVLFVLVAIGLVSLMSVQTTKNEGLSGSIGGRAESAYRGRLGLDQQLARLTGVVAGAFVVFAIVYFFVTR